MFNEPNIWAIVFVYCNHEEMKSLYRVNHQIQHQISIHVPGFLKYQPQKTIVENTCWMIENSFIDGLDYMNSKFDHCKFLGNAIGIAVQKAKLDVLDFFSKKINILEYVQWFNVCLAIHESKFEILKYLDNLKFSLNETYQGLSISTILNLPDEFAKQGLSHTKQQQKDGYFLKLCEDGQKNKEMTRFLEMDSTLPKDSGLIIASNYGALENVKALIPIADSSTLYFRCLSCACIKNHMECVKLLVSDLKIKQAPDQYDRAINIYALTAACVLVNFEMIEFLLANGADLNYKKIPIRVACFLQNKLLFEFLKKKGMRAPLYMLNKSCIRWSDSLKTYIDFLLKNQKKGMAAPL